MPHRTRPGHAMKTAAVALMLAACAAVSGACATPALSRMEASPGGIAPAPMAIGGRAVAQDGDGHAYQWPGAYFEAAFRGPAVAFAVGPGDAILHVRIDGEPVASLEKPEPGFYRIDGLADAAHVVRVETATESQAAPNRFGGFFLPPDSTALPAPGAARRIEFVGDSHTVGYGNLSTRRECSDAQVWAWTDNTRAFGPQVARHYGAGYRVNAISGRGVVRNYGGAAGDTLPQAYPYVLFDHSAIDADSAWQPQVVVVALGTNDFSTPLRADERWPGRDALHADYEQAYVDFIRSLRSRYPDAYFVLWATGLPESEVRSETQRVVARLRESGETRIGFVPVDGLSMAACHWHPSLEDHARIADALIRYIDSLSGLWPRSPASAADRPVPEGTPDSVR